jgi:hypothetical protein
MSISDQGLPEFASIYFRGPLNLTLVRAGRVPSRSCMAACIHSFAKTSNPERSSRDLSSSCNLLESAKFPGKIGGSASFPMPTLRECLHRGRSGRGVPVSGRPILVVFIGYGPNPLRRRRAVGKHNPTHDPPSAEDVVDFAASRDSAPEQKLGHGWPCATPQRKRQDDAGTQRWPWVLTPSRTPPRPCRAPSATSLQAASAGESRARKARPPAGQGMTRAGGLNTGICRIG